MLIVKNVLQKLLCLELLVDLSGYFCYVCVELVFKLPEQFFHRPVKFLCEGLLESHENELLLGNFIEGGSYSFLEAKGLVFHDF